jgi:hypothetical protein
MMTVSRGLLFEQLFHTIVERILFDDVIGKPTSFTVKKLIDKGGHAASESTYYHVLKDL